MKVYGNVMPGWHRPVVRPTPLSREIVWSMYNCLFCWFLGQCVPLVDLWGMNTCGRQETKAYFFLLSTRGLGCWAMPPYSLIWWLNHRFLEWNSRSLCQSLTSLKRSSRTSGQVGGQWSRHPVLLFKGLKWSRFHFDCGRLHSPFQAKSYQLPWSDESIFTKGGGLIWMYCISVLDHPHRSAKQIIVRLWENTGDLVLNWRSICAKGTSPRQKAF